MPGSKHSAPSGQERAEQTEQRSVSVHTDLDAVAQPERREQNSIEQRQALLRAKRTASSKQGRSQRIRQHRVMTEKARKVRARLVRRRNAPGMPDGREGEDCLAGSSERVVPGL